MELSERGFKRPATYVPRAFRAELHKLSKADLMEVAFDLAMRISGEDAGEIAAYDEVKNTVEILARHASRKEPRLKNGAELAKTHNHIEART